MVKTAFIKLENFIAENYSEVVRDSFEDVLVGGIEYKKLHAFSKYIDTYLFEKIFETSEDVEIWILEYEYKYFLIPLDLVPNISQYAGFVYQTFPDLIFDVVLENQIITVEGVDVEIPINQIKMIPCNCTKWTEEGVTLLDAVIENWNTTYPNKTINFPVKFESFDLFKAFRNEHVMTI